MEAMVFGTFGLIIGSFLNVLILRGGTDRSLGGRSSCPSCEKTLAWYDLVPVFSWLLLRGRCRYCGGRISLQYPLVELATAILFEVIGLSALPIFLKILGVLIASVYIAIVVYDIYHTLIPDTWSYAAAALALLYAFLARLADQDLLTLFLGGPLAALPLFSLWIFSRGRWMGLGDAKLAFSIGWLLGPLLGIAAVLGAFIFGALVSICVLLPLPYIVRLWLSLIRSFTRTPMVSLPLFFKKRQQFATHSFGFERSAFIPSDGKKTKTPLVSGFTMQSEVPFGPFLIASCLLFWFMQLYGVQSPLFFLGF